MSSGVVVPCDVVLPGGLVGGHGPVDDVDEVALQDPARAAGAFGWSVVCQQLLGCWAEALLHDGCGVKDAVEAAVSPAVEAVGFLARGGDRGPGAGGGARGPWRGGGAGDVARFGEPGRCGGVCETRCL